MEKNFSVRKYEKNTFNNYGELVSVCEAIPGSDRVQTMKFATIEEARAKAHEVLKEEPWMNKYYIEYCKIYEGRKCVETIEA